MHFSANSFAALAVALGVCFAAAFLGARVTTPEIPTWYASLAKPSWTPPRIAFPIVWPILYLLMAVSVWLLWEAEPSPARPFGSMFGFPFLFLTSEIRRFNQIADIGLRFGFVVIEASGKHQYLEIDLSFVDRGAEAFKEVLAQFLCGVDISDRPFGAPPCMCRVGRGQCAFKVISPIPLPHLVHCPVYFFFHGLYLESPRSEVSRNVAESPNR